MIISGGGMNQILEKGRKLYGKGNWKAAMTEKKEDEKKKERN
jgi:hypothetical protein